MSWACTALSAVRRRTVAEVAFGVEPPPHKQRADVAAALLHRLPLLQQHHLQARLCRGQRREQAARAGADDHDRLTLAAAGTSRVGRAGAAARGRGGGRGCCDVVGPAAAVRRQGGRVAAVAGGDPGAWVAAQSLYNVHGQKALG